MGLQWKLVFLASIRTSLALSELANCASSEMCSGSSSQQFGGALLQVGKHASSQAMPASVFEATVEQHVAKRQEVQYPINGATATLDQPGYEKMIELCCTKEMAKFAKRIVEDVLGFKVCDMGGVTGAALWHDCADDKGTFDGLKAALAAAPTSDCPFVSATDVCDPPKPGATCTEFPDVPLPDCPPTLACCAMPTSLLEVPATPRQNTSRASAPTGAGVAEWDCVAHPEPIQVMFNHNDGYDVSKLNINGGSYEKLYTIPFSITSPAYSRMNSVGFNPADKKMYAELKVSDKHYIFRFSQGAIEFVAELPDPGSFQPGVNKPGYNAGTFSTSGTFYIATNPKPTLFVIKDIASVTGVANPASALLLSTALYRTIPIPGADRTADIVAAPGKYAGGDEAEYVFLLDATEKLFVIKADTDDVYPLTTTGGAGINKGYGAGWNFAGRLFFANNGGVGVYEIKTESINLNTLEATLQKVGVSGETGKNDGANCLDAPSPWSGKCVPPLVDVLPVAGACPANLNAVPA